MVEAPAWDALRTWWLEQCVTRAITSSDPLLQTGLAHDYQGGLALMRAIENEVTNRQGDIDGRTARHTGTKAEAGRQGNGKRSNGAAG
jgi:hypothetical protein